jgi:hypothetical protein
MDKYMYSYGNDWFPSYSYNFRYDDCDKCGNVTEDIYYWRDESEFEIQLCDGCSNKFCQAKSYICKNYDNYLALCKKGVKNKIL